MNLIRDRDFTQPIQWRIKLTYTASMQADTQTCRINGRNITTPRQTASESTYYFTQIKVAF